MVTPSTFLNNSKKTSSSIMSTTITEKETTWKHLKLTNPTMITTTMNSPNNNNNNQIVVVEENDNMGSLQALREKFMPSKETSILPWEQYKTMSTTARNNLPSSTINNNNTYDDMMQDINVSYARVASAHFETLSITEADKLVKKFCELKKTVESMYEKIKLNTDTIRATVKSLKLIMPHQKDIFQLNEYTSQIKWLLDEFYFTSKYVHHLETTYLQHLAGTLYSGTTTCNKKEEEKDENFTLLTDILQRLRDIVKDDDHDIIISPHSSFSSISLTSVSSSTTHVQQQQDNNLLLQDIYTAIDKISNTCKQNKEQERKLDTYRELAKQRERSAELVLQLEKNRFLTTHQTLQDRVTTLEQTLLKKEAHIDTLVQEKNTLEQEKKVWLEMEKRIIDQCKSTFVSDKSDLESMVTQLLTEKKAIIQQQKESSPIIDNNNNNKHLHHLQNRFDQAIKAYTTRESAYILQSASTEAELGRLLKEYDRLTRNITDFNHERKKFESEYEELYKENSKLSRLLSDQHILSMSNNNDTLLRKEFRQLMSTVKSRHEKDMLVEISARRKVEHELKEKISEIEMKRWEKVDTAVQTYMQLPFM